MSGATLQGEQKGRLDQRLDRIEELEGLTHESIAGHIYPFDGPLKKIKLRGNVAVRPILILGPYDKEYEITFLYIAEERNGVLLPSKREVAAQAKVRLAEILHDQKRRRRYERP